jgi:hypothetical protein
MVKRIPQPTMGVSPMQPVQSDIRTDAGAVKRLANIAVPALFGLGLLALIAAGPGQGD